MRKFYRFALLAFGVGMTSLGAQAQCSDLFFSEYIEGSSNNKALEIYNPTGSSIDLAGYEIYRFNNGGTSPSGTYTFPTGTMVAAGDVYVIGNSSANAAILAEADTTNGVTFYNGDDALVLFNTSIADTIDRIGQVGVDPGSAWTVGTGATQNFTLVRMATIQGGQTDWAIGATEWDVFPQDTTMFLGSHSMNACAISGTGPCANLFFSEYIEGSSSNKALEIYNPTSLDADLTDYVVYRFNNGSTSATDSIFPQGMLTAGDVHVIGNPGADTTITSESDTTHSLTFFNGDDALCMIQISTGDTLDILGEIGVDPGSGWTVGAGATNNFTLVRMISVQEGQTNWTIGATEWDVFPIDMTDSLGAHTMTPCGAGPVDPTVFFTASSQTVNENVGTVTVTVGINNENANPTSVDVVLNAGLTTATGGGTDYSYTSPTTVTFPANDNTPQTVTITIVDDALTESSEDIVVDLMTPTNNATLGTSAQTITITDNDAVFTPTGSCSDLFFSEYAEGSSNNKYLEIYNPTLTDIDLSDYEVQRFTNGSASASGTYTWPAGTMIAAGDVYVIANSSADTTILNGADTTNAATFFNGDDAVLLYNTATADSLDIIGVVGVDPGTNWTVGTGATSEYTLVRMPHVQDGETDWNISSMQWDVYPQNTWDSLGTHTAMSCFSGPIVFFDTISSQYDEAAGTITVQVNIAGADANPTTVEVAATGGSATGGGIDYTYTTPTTVTFAGGSSAPQTISIAINDDVLAEGLEDIVLELQNPTNGSTIVADSVHTITIIDNDVPTVQFVGNSITVDEAVGTVSIDIEVINPAPTATDVDVVIDVASTATAGDYTYTGTTYNIPGGSTGPVTLTVTITDDAITESTEMLMLNLANPTNGAVLGTDSVYTITITDNDINIYDIGVINTTDGSGVADSANVYCGIRGTVYGVNMRGTNGLQFTVRDATGGIGIFSATASYGYTVNETDSVLLTGTIGQFNGLTQMNIDTVIVLGTGTLETPDVITALGEITESDLIVMQDAWLVDPSAWGTGNFNVDVTNGTDTITVRIDSDVDLAGMSAPTGLMDICGIGGQFDPSNPYDDGYQLLPRYMADVKPKVDLGPDATVCAGFELDAGWDNVVWSTTETTSSISVGTSGQYYVDVTYGVNTASDTINLTVNPAPVAIPSIVGPLGGTSTICDNYGPSTLTDQGSGATSWAWDFGDGMTSTDQSPTYQWNAMGIFTVTLITSNGTCNDTATMDIDAQICFSVEEFAAGAVKVYPTVTDGNITLDFNLPSTQRIQLMLNDLSGRQVMTQDLGEMNTNREQLNLGNLPSGLYLLTVAGENQQAVYKLMVR